MPKILIADPDPFLQDTMRQLLLARGHEVAAAATADAARERLAEDEHELLIAALELPGMTDLELLEAARRDRPRLPAQAVQRRTAADRRRPRVRTGGAAARERRSAPCARRPRAHRQPD